MPQHCFSYIPPTLCMYRSHLAACLLYLVPARKLQRNANEDEALDALAFDCLHLELLKQVLHRSTWQHDRL